MLKMLVACGALLCAAPALAGVDASDQTPAQTGIDGATLAQSPVLAIRIGGFLGLTVYVDLTRVGATSLKMRCTGGPTDDMQAAVAVAAVGTDGGIVMAPASWTYPVSASGLLRIQVAPLNDNYVRCIFSGDGATSDTIRVYARIGGTP